MSSGIVWHSNVSCIRVGGTPLAVEPKRGVPPMPTQLCHTRKGVTE